MEMHIRGAFNILYKTLYVEDPFQAKKKSQDMIRAALTAYGDIRRDTRYLMYPLLLKAVSAEWLPYEVFFAKRKNRIMAFLKATEADQIDPAMFIPEMNTDTTPNVEDEANVEDGAVEKQEEVPLEEEVKLEDEETMEQKAERLAKEAEKKALDN